MRTLTHALAGAFGLALAVTALTTMPAEEAAACPNFQGGTPFGSVQLQEGFLPDPYTRNVTAGGSNNLQPCLNVPGFVARQPDFRLFYTTSGNSRLTFRVSSAVDTVLLVNDPQGNWHYDDDGSGDMNGMLTFTSPSGGQWDVWIGTYQAASGIPARLIITELQ